MLTSQYDKRDYQHFTLGNGLKLLLVQQTGLSKSAVSFCVKAGHFQDPQGIPGLAHLLEHMLFTGSRDYPQANALNTLVEQQGGTSNAWTGTEYSNYFFDAPNQLLQRALAVFADMLTAPLFETSAIKTEIQTIDAEFQLKIKDELRRLYQVHKETCNPAHPFSRFSVGNQQTFEQHSLIELQQALREFHQQYYQPNNASLCVISSLPVQQSLTLIELTFGHLTATHPIAEVNYPPLYLTQQLGVLINIKPIKQARRLIATFALPSVLPYYASNPLNFISHLLGDEGKGSLLSYFKRQGWTNTLTAGGGISGSNFKDFNINMQLTESGIEHWQQILQGLFYYIELIKQHLGDVWRLREKQQLSQLAFDYAEKIKPLDEASHLANQLFLYPAEHLLSAEILMEQINEQAITGLLNWLTPQNLRVKLIYPHAPTNTSASWYQTAYQLQPLNEQTIDALSHTQTIKELSLPSPNPYIAEPAVQYPCEQDTTPEVLHCAEHSQIWFGQDCQFKLPKGDIYLSFDCQQVHSGIEIVTLKRLWAALLNERLSHTFYQAGIAGLHYHLYPHQGGFSLHTSGFAAKQMTLCLDILEHLIQQDVSSSQFEQIKYRQLTGLKNNLLNKPINRLFNRLSVLLQPTSHSNADMANTLEQATFDQLHAAKQQMLSEVYLQAFIYGDWSAKQAQRLGERILGQHPFTGSAVSRKIADLRQAKCQYHEVICPHPDAAVVAYFQSPSASLPDTALTLLLDMLLSGPFFHQLRTEDQVGYLVGSGYMPFNQHPGMVFYAQSPHLTGAQIYHSIQTFLHQNCQQLDCNEQQLEQMKHSLIRQLSEKDANLAMKSQRLWLAIGNQDIAFNRNEQLMHTIKTVTLQKLQRFAANMLNESGFGKLCLFAPGNCVSEPFFEGPIIRSPHEFKQTAEFI